MMQTFRKTLPRDLIVGRDNSHLRLTSTIPRIIHHWTFRQYINSQIFTIAACSLSSFKIFLCTHLKINTFVFFLFKGRRNFLLSIDLYRAVTN